MAWQGNDMGAAWEWYAMCESAFTFPPQVGKVVVWTGS